MRAIANKKQQRTRNVRKTRLEQGKTLSRRQLFVRRMFHRVEARVETLPSFAATMASVAIIGAFSIYGTILGGHVSALASSVSASLGFDVRSVSISGQHHMRERDILDILGLEPGVSLMTFDVARAHDTLLREPWVEAASVRKIYPGKLQIQLTERVPFAVWQRGRVVSVVDRNGLVLDDFNEETYGSLPILVGHGAQREGAKFLALMEQFPTLNTRVRASILHSERRWDILLDNAITVKLPEKGTREALAQLLVLDEEKNLLLKDLISIDMRLPDRLVMRLSDQAMVNRQATLTRRKQARSGEKKV